VIDGRGCRLAGEGNERPGGGQYLRGIVSILADTVLGRRNQSLSVTT
jgi:hypothetical protein